MERGRPERPLDEASGPVRDLAAALRALRAGAGNPSYRTMAGIAHFSAATLARAAAGHRLPSLDVVVAYATACGADREQWEQRWRACTEEMARESTQTPAVSALADQGAENRQLPEASRVGPQVLVPARRRWRTRQGASALAAFTLTAAVLLTAIVAADAPGRTGTSGAQTAPPDGGAMEPLGRACDPNGVIAPMPAHARPARDQVARVRASFEAGFDFKRDGWSPWWGPNNVVEDFTTSTAYDGRQSLRVRVTSGVTAIGTIHLAGLTPGSTVTVRIWYGGQGEGYICPFVQNKKYKDEWIPQPDLQLGPSDWPGWRTYAWTVPDFPLLGTGIELNDTGASDFVILLDAVTW